MGVKKDRTAESVETYTEIKPRQDGQDRWVYDPVQERMEQNNFLMQDKSFQNLMKDIWSQMYKWASDMIQVKGQMRTTPQIWF